MASDLGLHCLPMIFYGCPCKNGLTEDIRVHTYSSCLSRFEISMIRFVNTLMKKRKISVLLLLQIVHPAGT